MTSAIEDSDKNIMLEKILVSEKSWVILILKD